MPLSEEQQQEYDNWVEYLRKAIDNLMDIGSDNPELTRDDINDLVRDRIDEHMDEQEA